MRIELTPAVTLRAPSNGAPASTPVPAPDFPTQPAAPNTPPTPLDRVSLSAMRQPPLPNLAATAAEVAAAAPRILSPSPGTPLGTMQSDAVNPPVAPQLAQATVALNSQSTGVPISTLSPATSNTSALPLTERLDLAAFASRPAVAAYDLNASAATPAKVEEFILKNSPAPDATLQAEPGNSRSNLSQSTAATQSVQASVVKNIDTATARVVSALLNAMGADSAALLEKYVLSIRDANALPSVVADSPVYAAPSRSNSGGVSTLLTSLIMQGTVQTSDHQALSYRAALTLDRQALKALAPALAAMAADNDALKSLKLDVGSTVAELAGQQFSYTLSADPRGLWPAQTFILSGWLAMQQPVASVRKTLRDEDNEKEDEDAPASHKPKNPKPEEPAEPEIDDGGPPVISGQRWLSFKLHHLMSRFRDWIG